MKLTVCQCNLCGSPLLVSRDTLLDGISLEFVGPPARENEHLKLSQHPDATKHLCFGCIKGLKDALCPPTT